MSNMNVNWCVSRIRLAVLALVVLVLAACGGIPVATDYDPSWSVPTGATYAWVKRKPSEATDPFVDSDLVQGRVERAVDDQLRAQGMRRVEDADDAQLLVAYHIGEEEKIDIDTFNSWYGYYPCWSCGPYYRGYWPGHYGPYGPGSDVWVREYTEGKLMIDLADATSRKLVWRGVAERRVPSLHSPAEREAYIRETVSAIFAEFPPPAVP